MANWITSGRCLLLLVVVLLIYFGSPAMQLFNALLVVVTISLDGLDGYIARKRGEESVFGATFDIAADRMVENVMWVVLAHVGLIPVWVPLLFIARGELVDAIRSHGAAQGTAAFDMLRSPLAKVIVGGRFMRAFYAVVKATTFTWVIFWSGVASLSPPLWASWSDLIGVISQTLIVSSAALCILRGVPVVIEFVAARNEHNEDQEDSREAGAV